MIQEYVDKFIAGKGKLREHFLQSHPDDYKAIVSAVVSLLAEGESYGYPSPDRIHEIDDGDYQGTLVYVIAEDGYQPSDYWYVRVYYGSCSGCDTLESIRGYSDGKPTDKQADDYVTLAMHVVQGLRKMNGEGA